MSNKIIFECFISAVATAVSDKPLQIRLFKSLDNNGWLSLYELSKRQGLGAVIFESLSKLPAGITIPGHLKMKWISTVLNVERWYKTQQYSARSFAEEMQTYKIKTLVLKGLAVSRYYPIPSHREFGDLDCFLGQECQSNILWGDGYEKGNIVSEKLGAEVTSGGYKHSHINYKGIEIENHRYCLPIKGNYKYRALEKYLREILKKQGVFQISDSSLYTPSPDFNALFLTAHSFTHFLIEGIKFKHLVDWAVFLKSEQDNIDWTLFYKWTDELGFTRFVNTLNEIVASYFGITLVESIGREGRYVTRLLEDCLKEQSVYNRGYSLWEGRLVKMKNFMSGAWKFHKIYRKSVVVYLMSKVLGNIRN